MSKEPVKRDWDWIDWYVWKNGYDPDVEDFEDLRSSLAPNLYLLVLSELERLEASDLESFRAVQRKWKHEGGRLLYEELTLSILLLLNTFAPLGAGLIPIKFRDYCRFMVRRQLGLSPQLGLISGVVPDRLAAAISDLIRVDSGLVEVEEHLLNLLVIDRLSVIEIAQLYEENAETTSALLRALWSKVIRPLLDKGIES